VPIITPSIRSENFYVIKIADVKLHRPRAGILAPPPHESRCIPPPASTVNTGYFLAPRIFPALHVEMRNADAVTQLATPENETYCVDRRAGLAVSDPRRQ